MSKQFPSGNFPSSLENETDKLYHWCRGAPGAVHLMVKAYQVKKVWFGKKINGEFKIFRLDDLWSISLVCLRNISTGPYGSLRPDAGFT